MVIQFINTVKHLKKKFKTIFRVEKNATAWSKDKLKELLVGMVIENNECMSII
jgi:hypothetical protein